MRIMQPLTSNKHDKHVTGEYRGKITTDSKRGKSCNKPKRGKTCTLRRGRGSFSRNRFASLTCYQSVASSSKHGPSPSISGLTMRNIFIALLRYSRFCSLNCDGCANFSLSVRHFVEDVTEELLTFTVYKALEKRFLRKI